MYNPLFVRYYEKLRIGLTDRIDAVVNCTPICVNNKTKLTNLMIKSRIERV